MPHNFNLEDPGSYRLPAPTPSGEPGRILRNYSYKIQITTPRGTRFVTVSTNSVLTESQLMSEALVFANTYGMSSEEQDDIDVEITDAIRNSDFGDE